MSFLFFLGALFAIVSESVLLHQILELVDHVLQMSQVLIVLPGLVIRSEAFPEYLVLEFAFALSPPSDHLYLVLSLGFQLVLVTGESSHEVVLRPLFSFFLHSLVALVQQ